MPNKKPHKKVSVVVCFIMSFLVLAVLLPREIGYNLLRISRPCFPELIPSNKGSITRAGTIYDIQCVEKSSNSIFFLAIQWILIGNPTGATSIHKNTALRHSPAAVWVNILSAALAMLVCGCRAS